MVWVAAVTGLRWGEVARPTVGQLRLAPPGAITVDRQVGRGEHGEPVVEDPKSEAGFRTLSIPDELVGLFDDLLGSSCHRRHREVLGVGWLEQSPVRT